MELLVLEYYFFSLNQLNLNLNLLKVIQFLKMKVTKPNSIWTEFKINFKRGWNDGVELWVYALRRYLKFEI